MPMETTLAEISVGQNWPNGDYFGTSVWGFNSGPSGASYFMRYRTPESEKYGADTKKSSEFYGAPSAPSKFSFVAKNGFSKGASSKNSASDVSVQKDSHGNLYYTVATSESAITVAELIRHSNLPIETFNNFHYYQVKTFVCYTSNPMCTPLNVYAATKVKPAPFVYNAKGVVNGEINSVPGLGPIQHIVDASNLSVSNVTLGGHELFPGIVYQQVYQDGNMIGVRTVGIGSGKYARANEYLSPLVWQNNSISIREVFNDPFPGLFTAPEKFGSKAVPIDSATSVAAFKPDYSLLPKNFDAIKYGNANPDVKAAFNNDPDLMTIHYLKYGYFEGRNTGDGQPRVPPVVIDLDGDGIEISMLNASTATFDFLETGKKLPSAWVSKDDGFLVIDLGKNGSAHPDGKIDQLDELSFAFAYTKSSPDETGNHLSDLQAVKNLHDTNSNDLLDSGDNQWNSFRIWQDKNQNSVADEGELIQLDALGIEFIKLTSNGETSELHDGTFISGTSYAGMTSGGSYLIADVELAYGVRPGEGIVTAEQVADIIGYRPNDII